MSTIPQFLLNIKSRVSNNSITFSWPTTGIIGKQRIIGFRMQIRTVGQPWAAASTIKRPLSAQTYYTGSVTITNIPVKKNLQARLLITTAAVPIERSSSIVSFDTFLPPSTPINIIATRLQASFDISLSWNINDNGGSPLSEFNIEYSIDGGRRWYSEIIPIGNIDSINGNLYTKNFQFSADNRNNSFIFRVSAKNVAGLYSMVSNSSLPVYLPPIVGSSVLFDKTNLTDIPSPWRERIIFACEEWEKFVKIDPARIPSMPSNWQGIRIVVATINEPNNQILAACGIGEYRDFGSFYSNKFIPEWIGVVINIGRADQTDDEWRSTLVHELGHGLGIGNAWTDIIWRIVDQGQSKSVALVPVENGAAITTRTRTQFGSEVIVHGQMEKGYNSFHETQNIRHIPLIWQENFVGPGGITTIDENNRLGHFSFQVNPLNNLTISWRTIPQDIMSYGHLINEPQRITSLSIGTLLDLGYVLADTVIEATENVLLTYDNITKFLFANGIPVTFNGQNLKYKNDEFEFLAADIVQLTAPTNQLVVKDLKTGNLIRWNLSNNWEYLSTFDTASIGTSAYYALEVAFNIDFNKDGTIGQPLFSSLQLSTEPSHQDMSMVSLLSTEPLPFQAQSSSSATVFTRSNDITCGSMNQETINYYSQYKGTQIKFDINGNIESIFDSSKFSLCNGACGSSLPEQLPFPTSTPAPTPPPT